MAFLNFFKYYIRFFASLIRKSQRPPIIVASMGRSGSKLLYKSISEALANENFPFLPTAIGAKLSSGGMWDPSKKLFNGMVHKTHLHADEISINSGAKVIFLFSTPSEAVLSVVTNKKRKGGRWIKKHFLHLKANGRLEEIASKDVLRIEEQIDGWIKKSGTQRLILRYEKIWYLQSEIEKFINLKINLPIKRNRRQLNFDAQEIKDDCQSYYFDLDEKVRKLPDIKLLF